MSAAPPPFDLGRAREAFRAAGELHAQATREGAAALTAEDLDRLRARDAEFVRAAADGRVEDAIDADDAFHRVLLDAAGDPDPGVRVNALIALASFGDSMLVPALAPRLGDADPNVRQQAAATIGRLPGFAGLRALAAAVQDARQPWAVRHEALLGIARHDTTAFAAAGRSWRESADWRERAAAAEGWALAGHDLRGGPPAWLDDDEPRVVAWGLQAWLQAAPRTDSVLAAAARARLGAADAAVRSLAADALARSPDPADVPALAAMYQASGRDSFPQAALSALKALAAIARQSDSGRALVRRTFLQTVGDPAPGHADYLLREWAAHQWPELARRWGPPHPIATGHDDAFYLGVVRRYLLGAPNQRRPRVVIETEGAGPIELALLGPEAPLTVAHFLALVDAGFFNGHRWHRVVPNFVIQDGDPRGDGWGGPPGAIRDEINRVRYADPVLGMALDGPDTGNSQWFVNLSPQPHLDGTYTVFGRVVQGDAARSGRPSAAPAAALHRVTRGDRILRIRRVR